MQRRGPGFGADPKVRDERTINEAEAEVVCRVYRDFADFIGPRAIAQRLNAEGFAGTDGKLWAGSTYRSELAAKSQGEPSGS